MKLGLTLALLSLLAGETLRPMPSNPELPYKVTSTLRTPQYPLPTSLLTVTPVPSTTP